MRIPEEYIHWTDSQSLAAMSIACLGLMATLAAMIIFIRHNDTPVVKSSTRELSYIILVGMFLCHGTTFALLAKPSALTCFITRVLPGLSFAMIYAALVTKTNRIARYVVSRLLAVLSVPSCLEFVNFERPTLDFWIRGPRKSNYLYAFLLATNGVSTVGDRIL